MRRRWTKVECELRIGQGGDFDVRAGRLRKYAMVDLFGTPFTEKLQAVERYRLINFEGQGQAPIAGALQRSRRDLATSRP